MVRIIDHTVVSHADVRSYPPYALNIGNIIPRRIHNQPGTIATRAKFPMNDLRMAVIIRMQLVTQISQIAVGAEM